jgi:protein-L-isoaspartate(D-aspartate) O-methyltransferase
MPKDPWTAERRRLLDEIDADFTATAGETGIDAMGAALRDAIAAVPRHLFVPPTWRDMAYLNRPLPIGHGQTISQPFIVALMTALLELRPTDRVLEIGTGCGYQTAVLARLCSHVTSVEIVPELSARAAQTLAELGVANADLHVADGHEGWAAATAYDAIIATAAPAELPPAWLGQLAAGGRLVAPVGEHRHTQWLLVVHKDAQGHSQRRRTIAVSFVSLVHRH